MELRPARKPREIVMSRIFVLIAAALLAAAPAFAAQKTAPPPDPFPAAENLMAWINGYRHDPEPDKLPSAVQAMRRLGLVRDIEASGVFLGFIGGVLGENPQKAEALVTAMYPMPPEEQAIIIKSIAYSGLPDWKILLERFIERMPARKAMLRDYLYGQAKTLYDLPLEAGMTPIDTLWGNYFAAGSPRPVQRIVSALAWVAEKEDIDKLTAGGMAKWTLASNASRHRELIDVYRAEQETASEDMRKQLQEVISGAELFETQKIRKEALAAIEDLRRKGPVKKGTWWTWAAGAAPTAVGLACVTASALGQVEFGIPCIVGGALSTLGAKQFGTP